MIYKLLLLTVLASLPACSTTTKDEGSSSSVASEEQAKILPYYRFFRGMKKDSVTNEDFLKILGERFIPAAPNTHAKNGLVAYMPAVPPEKRLKAGLPDEIAIIAYESEEVYQKAKATPEGQAYSDMHWEIFNPETSKSLVPTPLDKMNTSSVEAEQAYDVINQPIDWQDGVSAIYIGIRKDHLAPDLFRKNLTSHLKNVLKRMGPRGLKGYLVIATNDYEIAYLGWKSLKAMEAANASEDGKVVFAEAGKIMDMQMWQVSEAKEFDGTMNADRLVNYKFQRRK